MDRDSYDRYVNEIDEWRRRAAGSGRWIALGVGALLVLVALVSSFYQVQPEEVGVVLRFGRYVGRASPASG